MRALFVPAEALLRPLPLLGRPAEQPGRRPVQFGGGSFPLAGAGGSSVREGLEAVRELCRSARCPRCGPLGYARVVVAGTRGWGRNSGTQGITYRVVVLRVDTGVPPTASGVHERHVVLGVEQVPMTRWQPHFLLTEAHPPKLPCFMVRKAHAIHSGTVACGTHSGRVVCGTSRPEGEYVLHTPGDSGITPGTLRDTGGKAELRAEDYVDRFV